MAQPLPVAFELKLFGRDMPCSGPSVTKELEVIARPRAGEIPSVHVPQPSTGHIAKQAQRSAAQESRNKDLSASALCGVHICQPGGWADTLRVSRDEACPELGSTVRVGRPETAAVLLCVCPAMSGCRGLDSLNGCHEGTTDVHGWGHLFCLSPRVY